MAFILRGVLRRFSWRGSRLYWFSYDPARLVADSAAARQLLGWETQFAELETIIHHAWRWEYLRR